jgi:Arc/MetJ-type ribon-helix-helix transcriptional regulator
MNVNLHLAGEVEAYINSLVSRGLAASKTEAIRLTIVQARQRELEIETERQGVDRLQHISMKAVWDNKKDEKAAEFYERAYGHGKKK